MKLAKANHTARSRSFGDCSDADPETSIKSSGANPYLGSRTRLGLRPIVESIEIHTTLQALLPRALFLRLPRFGKLILAAGKRPGRRFSLRAQVAPDLISQTLKKRFVDTQLPRQAFDQSP
jgi:hypothetical protein